MLIPFSFPTDKVLEQASKCSVVDVVHALTLSVTKGWARYEGSFSSTEQPGCILDLSEIVAFNVQKWSFTYIQVV